MPKKSSIPPSSALPIPGAEDDSVQTLDLHLSRLTGEFIDSAREQHFLHDQWLELARQVRVVLWLGIITYSIAFFQNYLDLSGSGYLGGVAFARLFMFGCFGLAIYVSYTPHSPRLPWLIFMGEIATALSETVEMVAYQFSGITINLISAPFYAFLILIFFIFLRISWWMTTVASLLGSGLLVLGYAYIAPDQLLSIMRHPILLVGIIAIGGGVTRVMNRSSRLSWELNRQLKHEIAVRRRSEENAVQTSKAMEDFLAVMSHEIRTPLNSILAMAEMLTLSTDDANRTRRLVDILSRAGQHLHELVENVLDYSSMQADAVMVREREFNLRKTTEEAVSSLKTLAEKKGLTLRMAFDPYLPIKVKGDPKRIRQILINLIGNAIKFTPSGNIEVRLEHTSIIAHGVCFTVTDSGPGIPEDDLDRIFNAFHQATVSDDLERQGVGLGLSICQRLIAQMQGTIVARNRPAGGGRF